MQYHLQLFSADISLTSDSLLLQALDHAAWRSARNDPTKSDLGQHSPRNSWGGWSESLRRTDTWRSDVDNSWPQTSDCTRTKSRSGSKTKGPRSRSLQAPRVAWLYSWWLRGCTIIAPFLWMRKRSWKWQQRRRRVQGLKPRQHEGWSHLCSTPWYADPTLYHRHRPCIKGRASLSTRLDDGTLTCFIKCVSRLYISVLRI